MKLGTEWPCRREAFNGGFKVDDWVVGSNHAAVIARRDAESNPELKFERPVSAYMRTLLALPASHPTNVDHLAATLGPAEYGDEDELAEVRRTRFEGEEHVPFDANLVACCLRNVGATGDCLWSVRGHQSAAGFIGHALVIRGVADDWRVVVMCMAEDSIVPLSPRAEKKARAR